MLAVMRIALELTPAGGDRLEGRIVTGDGRADIVFSGTLDLLRVLEELRCAEADAADTSAGSAPTLSAP